MDLLKDFTLKEAVAHEQYMSKGPINYIFSHVKKPNNFYSMWNSTMSRLTEEQLQTLGDSVLDEFPGIKAKITKPSVR